MKKPSLKGVIESVRRYLAATSSPVSISPDATVPEREDLEALLWALDAAENERNELRALLAQEQVRYRNLQIESRALAKAEQQSAVTIHELEAENRRLSEDRKKILAEAGLRNVDPALASVSGDVRASDGLVPEFKNFRDQIYEDGCHKVAQQLPAPQHSQQKRVWRARLKSVICDAIIVSAWTGRTPPSHSTEELVGACVNLLAAFVDGFGVPGDSARIEACKPPLTELAANWIEFAQRLSGGVPPVDLIVPPKGAPFDPSSHEPILCGDAGSIQDVLFPGLQIVTAPDDYPAARDPYRVYVKAYVFTNVT